MTVLALIVSVLSLASGDPDGVISTAPKTDVSAALNAANVPTPDSPAAAAQAQSQSPHGLTTDEQIDRWLASRSPDARPFDDDRLQSIDDRQVHGMVSAGIGTEGYSNYSGAISLPVGDGGRVDLFYSRTENGIYPYGAGYDGRSSYDRFNYGRGRQGGYPAPFAARQSLHDRREQTFGLGAEWRGSEFDRD